MATTRADRLLVAAGRAPNTDGLNLEAVGVHTDERGFVRVDGTGRTSVRHILAVGDVTGDPLLVTVAAQAAQNAVNNALNGRNEEIDLSAVPTAVFSDPQVASVGLAARGGHHPRSDPGGAFRAQDAGPGGDRARLSHDVGGHQDGRADLRPRRLHPFVLRSLTKPIFEVDHGLQRPNSSV